MEDMSDRLPSEPWPCVTVDGGQLARRELKLALLQHERVVEALLELAEIRDRRYQAQSGGARYHACLTLTASTLRVFSLSEVDHHVSVIRERRAAGIWGLSLPGFDQGAPPPRDPVGAATIAQAAELLARRLDAARRGSRERTDLDLADELVVESNTVRKAVSRLTAGLSPPARPPASERSWRRFAAAQRASASRERTGLDSKVAAGELHRWTEADFRLAAESLGLPPDAFGPFDPEIGVYTDEAPAG
jgi:multidrug efflux pump subunit AcrA (membrane-fusion protein)